MPKAAKKRKGQAPMDPLDQADQAMFARMQQAGAARQALAQAHAQNLQAGNTPVFHLQPPTPAPTTNFYNMYRMHGIGKGKVTHGALSKLPPIAGPTPQAAANIAAFTPFAKKKKKASMP